jgi:putative phosphoesterase
MKLLLIGDIHANKIALQSVLAQEFGIDVILCTGDLVDYNPWPLEVIRMVEIHHIQSVKGNHDRDSALGTPLGYNPYAEVSCRWTHHQLGLSEKHYLLGLPDKLELNFDSITVFLCHGSPYNLIDEYVFPPPLTPRAVLRNFLLWTKAHIVVLGHTHIPFIQKFPEGYVVNPGSVGQPRSGDPRASYVIMGIEEGKVMVEHRLIEYNVEKVETKIIEVGLPMFLASRLYLGI